MVKSIDYKVEQILQRSVINTKKLLAIELGISRPTLNSRMSGKTKWGKLEKNWIGYIYSKLNNNK
jgi:predicted DNA-binding transcriptional regulator